MLRQFVVAGTLTLAALNAGVLPAADAKQAPKSRRPAASSPAGAALKGGLPIPTKPVVERPKTDPKTVLSQQQLRQVDAVAAAYAQGNTAAVLELLSPLIAQFDDDQLAALDQILSERQDATAAQIITDFHLGMVFQGFASKLHRPKARETLILVPELHGRLIASVREHDAHAIKDEPLPAPKTIEAYEALFWSVHVLKNRLLNAERLAQYGLDLTKSFSRTQIARLKGEAKEAFEADYAGLLADVRRRVKDVEERSIGMRIARLQKTVEVLSNPKISTERFLAAYAADADRRLIEEFLSKSAKEKRKHGAYGRKLLTEEGVFEAAKADARRAAELAGDLTTKANCLAAGLHWWLRGRYGRGPDAMGLAKSVAAMDWPQAQLALYMPPEMPRPTNPRTIAADKTPVPRFDRRHHYWWAWEDRRLQHLHLSGSQTSASVSPGDAGGGKNVQVSLAGLQRDTPFW